MNYAEKILKLASTSGSNAKKQIIQDNTADEKFMSCLYYLLNPHFTYNISDRTIDKYTKNSDVEDSEKVEDFNWEWYRKLNDMTGVNLETVHEVCYDLLRLDATKFKVHRGILSKSLKLGVSPVTVNKVVPGFIPTWDIQQAFSYDNIDVPDNTEFWLTQKLNGVRATYYKGKFYSRNGSEYKGLQHITKELDFLSKQGDGFVFDGELTLKKTGEYANLSDNEAFRTSTGIINSLNESKEEIMYTVFDIIPLEDFDSATPEVTYDKRREYMDFFFSRMGNSQNVFILPVLYHGNDQSVVDPYLNQMVEEDKEGLMMNLNVPYQRKRHNGILKIKKFYTIDLPIIGLETGTGKNSETLGNFVLDFKGNEVRVGSGFTDEQRDEYWFRNSTLIGTLCEVKYKEITEDKNTGKQSLQFPVFVQLRADKTQVSYD